MNTRWDWAKSASSRHEGPLWLKPIVAAAPWITLCVLVLMMSLASGVFALSGGVVFELPQGLSKDAEGSELVALVMPTARETLVFFDDARFSMDDPQSLCAFLSQLTERARKKNEDSLLVLADKRVAGGEIFRLAGMAREAGLRKILFAEKKEEEL